MTSVPSPLILARLQLVSQSVSGDASSALDLMYSLLVSMLTMVTSFSTRTLYHCAVDIVVTFRGVFSFNHLIESKKDAEK